MSIRLTVLSMLLVCAVASPSRSVRFYVDKSPDRGDDRRSVMSAQNPDTPFRTIEHALRIAHLIPQGRPHIIEIATGTYTPDDENLPLRISQSGIQLRSTGNLIFDARGQSGFLEITGPTDDFVLQDMSFVNGLAERGGVIYCDACSLRVDRSRFISNRATMGGALIYQRDGRLEFTNNQVRTNGAPGSDSPLIEIHNTFSDTSQRDIIRNNTFYLNETPAILTSGNRTDISSNIFVGIAGSDKPAIVDSTEADSPLVRYNLFWDTDILLIAGTDSVKLARTVLDTIPLTDLGVVVPDFVTNQPDTVAKAGELYEYDIQVEGNKSFYKFYTDSLGLPEGMTIGETSSHQNHGIIQWTPALADTGSSDVQVDIVSPQGVLRDLTYHIRVYTPESFPDTSALGPIVTVTFEPDTTGALDSLNTNVPAFSSAASAGGNGYDDPLFLNPDYKNFQLLVTATDTSAARDRGNPIVDLWDNQPLGTDLRNDAGMTGGPLNPGPPAPGTHLELTISTLPDSIATEGQEYVYEATVVEPGSFYNIALIPGFTGPPSLGGSFGSGIKPPIRWTPTLADTGAFLVGIQLYTSANTANGGRHYFPLRVRAENEPPTITSTPPTEAFEDSLLSYAIQAVDPNGDDILYSLVSGPDSLTMDSSGVIRWTPVQNDVGTVDVHVTVADSKGAGRAHIFTLIVRDTNDPPQLQAVADTTILEDAAFELSLVATDPDSADVVAFTLVDSPDSASIDTGGTLRWTPVQADVGEHRITVQATDLTGASVSRAFAVTVVEVDDPPAINTLPDTLATEDQPYTYALGAVDEENATLSYSLTSAPEGMVVDTAGVVRWTPTVAHVGPNPVTVSVTDPGGQADAQTFNLVVLAVNDPPLITARDPVDSLLVSQPGLGIAFSISAADEESDPLSFEWQVNGSLQGLTGSILTLTPDSSVVDTVVVSILDGTDTTSTRWIVDGRAIARIRVAADSLDFGAVAIGDTGAVVLGLNNPGQRDLGITNLQVGNLEFSAIFGSSMIAAGDSTGLELRYIPSTRGAKSSSIQFGTNDPDHPTVSIAVLGRGLVPTTVTADLDPAAGHQGALQTKASPGDLVTVDLYAEQALGLISYTLILSHDAALSAFEAFDPKGPEDSSLLGSGNSLVQSVNYPGDGQVQIEVVAQPDPVAITGSGILGRVSFAVDSSLTQSHQLAIRLVRVEALSSGQSLPDTVATGIDLVVAIAPRLIGDFDFSGLVDFDDFFLFADHFGTTDPFYDLDASGLVGYDDFFIFADHFGSAAPKRLGADHAAALPGLRLWPGSAAQSPGQLRLSLGWQGDVPLRGVAMDLAFDPDELTFRELESREIAGPLTLATEDRPGVIRIAAGLASSQRAFTGDDLGVLVFERHSDASLAVRPLMARAFVEDEQGHVAVSAAPPALVRIPALPTVSALHPAYPNPFNPETVISFSLDRESEVQLRVYDLLGRSVITLVNGVRTRGRHSTTWAATDSRGRIVAAGVYLIELRTDDFHQVRKVMLVK